MTTERLKFTLDSRHLYFTIKNGALYEVISGLRSPKVRHRLDLEGVPDCEKLTEDAIKEIEQKFLK